MRYREPFTLYLRKLPSGKKIWYYQTYDDNNKRTSGFSTGKKSKTAAKAYCFDLLKKDLLIPERRTKLLFEDYSKNWWDWEKCEYLIYTRKRKNLTQSYAKTSMGVMNNYLIPVFGKKEIKEIKSYEIEKWLDSLSGKGLSNTTARFYLAIFKIMLKEAVRRDILKVNPADSVMPLKDDTVRRGVLNQDEVTAIFNYEERGEIWDDELSYYANLLSACTGMRMGEILAVRGECLMSDYIRVDKQFKERYGLCDTKSHYAREVIIPEQLMTVLKEYSERNNGGYVFSKSGGKRPMDQRSLRDRLNKAMKNIGIDDEERRKRNICFHSWRHYLNTTMRSNNIMDGKLRAMVGHSSQEMTDHYTHFNKDDYKDIQKVQNKIINFEKVG